MDTLPTREIEKHQAIPHGTIRLLTALLVPISISLLLAWMWHQTPRFVANPPTTPISLLATFTPLWICCYILTPILLPTPAGSDISCKTFPWLKEFWRRNMIGESLWLYVESKYGEPTISDENAIKYHITSRFEFPNASSDSALALRIPLGGWFRGDHQALFRSRWPSKNLQIMHFWKVTGIRLDGGRLVVKLEDGDEQFLWIDPHLFINRASFQWSIVPGCNWSAQDWSSFSSWSTMALDEGKLNQQRLQKRLQRNEEELGQFRDKLEKANALARREIINVKVTLLHEFIARLSGTKRFIHSKDAEKIRKWAIEELLKILPSDHPLRGQYEQKDPALAEAETGT